LFTLIRENEAAARERLRLVREREKERKLGDRVETEDGKVFRPDGHGCVERVHPTELAFEERYG
jgi:hypothetical protein